MTTKFRKMVDGLENALPRWLFQTINGVYATLKILFTLLFRYGWMKSVFSWKSIDPSNSPVPWFSYPAIEYLEGLDLSDYDVLEIGSGYSTLYWSKYAKSVIAIEDHEEWIEKLSTQVGENAQIQFAPAGQTYLDAISNQGLQFDIILIDGLDRFECIQLALPKLKEGGFLILDDADRYPEVTDLLRKQSLLQIDFAGFNPINSYTKTTSFFIHRSFTPKPRYQKLPLPSWGHVESTS